MEIDDGASKAELSRIVAEQAAFGGNPRPHL
jgi:hypothetical protein